MEAALLVSNQKKFDYPSFFHPLPIFLIFWYPIEDQFEQIVSLFHFLAFIKIIKNFYLQSIKELLGGVKI